MPFVEASAAPKQNTGGGGFRVAGASLVEQPPKWKPDVLAAVAPQRKIDWMGERDLPVVGQFEHSGGHRADVISYPAPTDKDPNNRVLLVPPKVPQRPAKGDEWLYGKEGYDAWLAKNGHRYQPSIVEKDAKTGKYRITGTYLPSTKRDNLDAPTFEDVPEVEAFARNRETLELLKGRNPEKFASAMKDYENYLVAKQRSPLAAIPLGQKAMEQFKEIMPEGGYDRWVSERKQVERGVSNPPLALNKAGSDQKPTAFKPSETRGDYATNLGIPVESLLQDEDAAARKKFQESQVSDSAAGRFGQSFATGVESVSSGLNRILNPFVSDETLDEVGRNRDSFRQVVQDKGGPIGDVFNKAADSTGTMAAGAAVGAVTGGTASLMALAAGIAQYDDAYREATDAGLRGEQRTQYAMAQAGWEAGTSLVFTKALKIPGVEGAFARGAVGGKTFGEILKRVAVQSGVSGVEEIPEEVTTAIGQNLTAKLSGVDPNRAIITPEELTDIITQSFVQSGMMTGARNAPDLLRSLKPGQQQTAAGDQPAATAGANGPEPQQGPPALPILPPPSAATADTTDFIPAELDGAKNVNGLAQASPQVPWSNQVIRPQVLPAETNGNTAELPVARLAGETKAGGETPTPDPLRKLQPLPTSSDQVAVWAIENPELVLRVAEATKDGQPLTRAMMDSLGLKRGNAEQRAAFVKALFPEQTQGATDASKTPSPAETQVLSPEPAAASTPEAVTTPEPMPPVTKGTFVTWTDDRGNVRHGVVKNRFSSGITVNDGKESYTVSEHKLRPYEGTVEFTKGDKVESWGKGLDAVATVIGKNPDGSYELLGGSHRSFNAWPFAMKKVGEATSRNTKTTETPPAHNTPETPEGSTPPNTSETPNSSTTTAKPKGKRPAAPKRPAEPPQPVPRTARLALSNYTIRNRYHDKKRAALRDADAEYQRLKAAADAERRAESAQQATMTKREKEAERAQAQQEIAAGNVNRDNVKYALLHEVEPELRDRIQTEAQRLLGETESADVSTALKKIIKDAGADVGAGVEKQKERIVKILTGELDQRNAWTKNTEAPRPPDPIVQLLLAPQADRGTTIAAAQRSVADGTPDALAVYAREQVESELNKDRPLEGRYVGASEDQILDKLGEVADLVGATMPEGDTGFDFGDANEPQAEPLGIESLKRAFKLSDDQAEAVNALADAIGLDVKKIAVAAGGQPGPDALDQAAYHGTPHTFDKFSTNHIGTGEGAQAYGWGLYFAGNKEVARWYKDKLAKKNSVEDLRENIETAFDFEYPDEAIENYREYFTDDQWPVVVELQKNDWLGFDHPLLSIRQAFHHLDDFDPSPELREAIKEFRRKTDGKLYEVDLKPADDEYLLWDKPYGEQSEKVKAALEKLVDDEKIVNSEDRGQARRYATGKQLYEQTAEKLAKPANESPSWTSFTNTLNDKVQNQRAASEYLKSLGIRGIKYLDGSSRSKGEGHYNYVIFDDADVEITNVLYQGRKGAAEFAADGQSIIRGFDAADVSTGVHEIAHVARRQLLNRTVAPEDRAGVTDEDIKAAEDWAGAIDGNWTREAEEKFARGFERYLAEGKAPVESLKKLFAKMADWLRSIYSKLTGSEIDVAISEPMQKVFDRLVTRADRLRNPEPFTLKRESATRPAGFKFDNAEGEQRRMFSGMDALPGQEDLFEDLDKAAEAGQGFQSQDSAEPSRKGPNPFRKNTRESSAKAAASTETSAGQSARRPNPFGKVPRATRSNASEASAEPSKDTPKAVKPSDKGGESDADIAELMTGDEKEMGYPSKTAGNMASPMAPTVAQSPVQSATAAKPYIPPQPSNQPLPPVNPKDRRRKSKVDVMRHLVDALKAFGSNAPIRSGRVVGKALGIFKVYPEIIRLRASLDLATAAHEVGHAIEKAVYAWNSGGPWVRPLVTTAMQRELAALGRALYGNRQPNGGYKREGFAEFMRLWLSDQPQAKQSAPLFADWFENTFLASHQEGSVALKKATEAFTIYNDQGSVARGEQNIVDTGSIANKLRTIGKLAREIFSFNGIWEELSALKDFDTSVADVTGRTIKFGSKSDFSTRSYDVAKSLRGTSAARLKVMREVGMIDIAGNLTGGKALSEVADLVKSSERKAFTVYLYARRAQSLLEDPNGPRDPGITLEDAKQIIAELETPQFQNAAKIVYDWQSGLLDYVAQASPTLAETVTRIRTKDPGNYIPLFREFDELERMYVSSKSSNSESGQLSKRLVGSGRRVIDPVHSLLTQAQQLIETAHDRMVLETVLKAQNIEGVGHLIEKLPPDQVPLATAAVSDLLKQIDKKLQKQGVIIHDQNGQPIDFNDPALAKEFITLFGSAKSPQTGEPIIPVFENGEWAWYVVPPNLFEAIRGADPMQLSTAGRLLDWSIGTPLRVSAHTLRMGATGLNTGFSWITNTLMDFQGYYTGTRTGRFVAPVYLSMKQLPLAFADALSGGRYGSQAVEVFRRLGGQMAQNLHAQSGFARRQARSIFGDRLVSIRNGRDAIAYLRDAPGRALDFAGDVLQFSNTAFRAAEIEGVANQEGIDLSKPLSLEESLFLLLAAKEVTVDFSATGAVTRRASPYFAFMRAALQGPRSQARAFENNPTAYLLKAMVIAGLAAASWMTVKDEEWWKQLTPLEKMKYWYIPVNWNGRKEVIQIPREQTTGYFFGGGTMAALDELSGTHPDAAMEWAAEFTDAVASVGSQPLAEEVIEQLRNKDSYTGKPIVSSGITMQPRPTGQEYDENTSALAKWAGEEFGASPMRLDHAITGLGGGLARDVTDAIGAVAFGERKATGRDAEPADMPIVGRLFRRGGPDGTRPRTIDEFYIAARAADVRSNDIKQPESEVDKSKRLLLDDAGESLSYLGALRRSTKSVDERRAIMQREIEIAGKALSLIDGGAVPVEASREMKAVRSYLEIRKLETDARVLPDETLRKKADETAKKKVGGLLFSLSDPTPTRGNGERQEKFDARKLQHQADVEVSKRALELLDLTAEEKQQLLKDEAKRRGNGTKRWEGEYNNRRTDFGRREAKLKTLSP